MFKQDSHPNQAETVGAMKERLEDIRAWMAANQLKLNDDKTEIILIGTQQQLDNMNISHLNIAHATMPLVSSAICNLSSWFDINLTMTLQVNKTCQSTSYQLHNIGQIRKFLTPVSNELLVQGVIMARIDYCNSLLYGVLAGASF